MDINYCEATGEDWHFLIATKLPNGIWGSKCRDCHEFGGHSYVSGYGYAGNGVCAPVTKTIIPSHPLFWSKNAQFRWFDQYIRLNEGRIYIDRKVYKLAGYSKKDAKRFEKECNYAFV